MLRGRFISLEGGEGAGKSTQLNLLAERLVDAGIKLVTTREPGGTKGAETIRELFVSGATDRWDAATEACLVNAARADHVARQIRPALERGDWVLCDRYADSTFAYQGGDKGVPDADLMALHRVATGDLWPDLTLLLDLPVETGLARTLKRIGGATRFEAHDLSFHQRVAARFHARAAAEPRRIRTINADIDAHHVAAAIWAEGRATAAMLIGHREQGAAFRAAFDSKTLHHAWLIAGAQGIGKAGFARAAALWVLARSAGPQTGVPTDSFDVSEDHPTARLLTAGSHLDFRVVERIPDPKDRKAEKLRAQINLDQIVPRDGSKVENPLRPFLQSTPALSDWRVVIVDSIDDMNRNAANALLKSLEEPPAGTLFLLRERTRPGRLLATIRSRCRILAV
jgi:dTMP kinase